MYTLFEGQRISFREYLHAFLENKRNFGCGTLYRTTRTPIK